MNLPIKKLTKSVQSLICASNHINSYTKAIQELVFNSLDADATSIAVRIHIGEGSLQVVDNGCGIPQVDFRFIGQKYMTSKLVDVSTLRSLPSKYGFQGQSLANLAQIAKTLKVTSRFHKSETTCMKIFENGKEKLAKKCSARPSKGTTVEVKGFLHNLKIQKQSVSEINQLQNIKTFLEHISLVHSKISISLRDDAKNEILYKMHKNRDMYQTLSTLYDLDKTNVQELQVEKNQYKVKAYIGKLDVESTRHIIFINGKVVPDCSCLHKKLNDNFKKHLGGGRKNIKKNQNNDNENYIYGSKIPFYFLFITCPYVDYEMTNTVLEFKDCGQINTLLDKLVKFYIGDIILTKVTPKKLINVQKNQESESTRNQIEKIMHKILGTHSKKPDICQMQKGVKGKMIKRKTKNKSIPKTDGFHSIKIKHKSTRCIEKNHNSNFTPRHEQNITINDGLTSSTQFKLIKNAQRKNVISTSPLKTLKTASKTKYLQFEETKTPIKIRRNKHKKRDKVRKNKKVEKISLSNKFAQETDSVKRGCETPTQESRRLIMNNNKNPALFRNENVYCTRGNLIEDNRQILVNKRVTETIIHEYIPKPTQNFAVRKNHDIKSFKSNFDLLQTIINSQITKSDFQKETHDIISVVGIYKNSIETENQKVKNTDLNIRMPSYNPENSSLQRSLNSNVIPTPEQNFRPFLRNIQSDMSAHIVIPHEEKSKDLVSYNERIFDNIVKETGNGLESYDMNNMSSSNRVRDHLKVQTETFDSHKLAKSLEDSPFLGMTYQSHNYYDLNVPLVNNVDINYSRKFIQTQSRGKYTKKNNFMKNNYFKGKKKNLLSKLLQSHTRNLFDKLLNTDSNTKSKPGSYTIELGENNKHDYTAITDKKNNGKHYLIDNISRNSEAMSRSMEYISNNFNFDNKSPDNPNSHCSPENDNNVDDFNYEPSNENTDALTNPRIDHDMNLLNHSNWDNNETYTLEKSKVSNYISNIIEETEFINTKRNTFNGKDFVFISKSVEKNGDDQITINPIDVCETILTDPVSTDKTRHIENDFERNNSVRNVVVEEIENCNTIVNVSMNIDFSNFVLPERVEQTQPKCQEHHIHEEISQHFTIPDSILSEFNQSLIMTAKPEDEKTLQFANKDLSIMAEKMENNETVAFNLKNRLFFVPKGMSPIFEDRQKKQQFEFNPIEEYYENEIYDNFVDKVNIDVEIFKPRLDERNDMVMKNFTKFTDKINKDNASLKFDGDSIKAANVLGQIDNKFIAAIIKSKYDKDDEEFLVLFDQHAVHERIRLENNLAEYVTGNQWKSVGIDEITFKMSRDNIIYLHNYKDKFTQFGLEWTIPNYNEISVTAIPEGILGKNPRPVEKIIAAVKNVITEEINVIQMQRGCVSLYPKSIMDLVFSEACRYAIKFGDHLSKSQCVELLNSLSDCKTPFQCAHGRPAMALIMNVEKNKNYYKANFSKLKQFKNC